MDDAKGKVPKWRRTDFFLFSFLFFFDAVNLALAGFIIEIFSAKGGQL